MPNKNLYRPYPSDVEFIRDHLPYDLSSPITEEDSPFRKFMTILTHITIHPVTKKENIDYWNKIFEQYKVNDMSRPDKQLICKLIYEYVSFDEFKTPAMSGDYHWPNNPLSIKKSFASCLTK